MPYDYETFFDQSLDMLCIAGTDGYLKRVNRAFTRTLGWTAEQLLAQPLIEFIHPEDVDRTLLELERLSTGIPTTSFDNRYRCADGSYRNLHWTAYPDPDAGVVYGSARDITSRLRDRDRFRLAINASPSALVMVDRAGEIVLINEASEKLFGYERDQLLGQPIEVLVPERLRGQHRQDREAFARSPRTRAMGPDRTLKAVKCDGSEFPVEVGLRHFESNGDSYVLAAVSDLSERSRAAGKLAAAAKELERSNRELEQFAYVASHDLQEPLRMVAGYTQLLAKRYADHLDEEGQEFIGFAVEGVTRMQQLIQDLLSLSRVQSQGHSFESVSTGGALDWAVANLEHLIVESNAEITQGELPTVSGDSTQISQLFQNLISNSIKFRSERSPRVHIEARVEGINWLFSVRDNGIGIDPAHRREVFQVFHRLHAHEQYDGTGIGLSICQKIIERHGGTIWCEAAVGGGTTFLFTLPAAVAAKQPSSDSAASLAGSARTEALAIAEP